MESIMSIDEDGDEIWELPNTSFRFHREGGLPAITHSNGIWKQWWHDGRCHRTDGPAFEWKGQTHWYIDSFRIYSVKHFQELTGHSNEYMAELLMKYGPIR